MKYFLSVEFENQGEPTNYKVGDIITFVTMLGFLKNGVISEIKYIQETNIPSEYKVDCNGKSFTACVDYVLKANAKVLNLKSTISEFDDEFPLRT